VALPAIAHGAAASALFLAWLWQRESSTPRRLAWGAAHLVFGSPATAVFIIGAVADSRIERTGMVSWPRFWLGEHAHAHVPTGTPKSARKHA